MCWQAEGGDHGVAPRVMTGNSSRNSAVASRRLATASSTLSPCVVVPVSGLSAVWPPSSAGVRTAVNSMTRLQRGHQAYCRQSASVRGLA